MTKAHFVIPSLERLADIMSGLEAARRAAIRAGGEKGRRVRAKRLLARRRAHWRKPTGGIVGRDWGKPILALPGWKVLIARLDPNWWYGVQDAYVLMPEYAAKSVRSFFCQSVRLGLMERGLNEAFDHSRAPGTQTEPMYLYRLSPAGEAGRKEWQKELTSGAKSYEAMSL
jgi:hypothetical protein